MKKIKLNIGCGSDYKNGFINIDTHKNYGADLVHQLPQVGLAVENGKYKLKVDGKPLPFKDNSVDHIYCSRMLEDFLYEYVPIMHDFHRVLKKGGILRIIVPYGLDVRNPRHVRFFDETSFDEFCRSIPSQYKEGHVPPFNLVKMNLIRKNKILMKIGKSTYKGVLGRHKSTKRSDRRDLLTVIWRSLLKLTSRIKSIEVVMKKN